MTTLHEPLLADPTGPPVERARVLSTGKAAEENWVPPDEHLVSLLSPDTYEAEQYRQLRHLVEEKNKTAGVQVLGVTSPAVGDGKTLTALNLAGTMAQSPGLQVLVVDGDLRRPSVPRVLGMRGDPPPGLAEIAASAGRPLATGVVRRRFDLSVLSAGAVRGNPYEVLKSPRMGELLDEARQSFDYVIVDTPPILPFPDCRLIERWVDAWILVVAAHRTPRKVVETAIGVLSPEKLLGMVLNEDDNPTLARYYRTYHRDRGRRRRGE